MNNQTNKERNQWILFNN